jgi:hypothetical protein
MVNLLVSFGLALWVALRARKIRFRHGFLLLRALGGAPARRRSTSSSARRMSTIDAVEQQEETNEFQAPANAWLAWLLPWPRCLASCLQVPARRRRLPDAREGHAHVETPRARCAEAGVGAGARRWANATAT